MSEGASLSQNINSENLTLTALDHQIDEHKKSDDNRSLLSWAVSQVWRQGDNSLTDLEKLSKQAHDAEKTGDSARLAQLQGDMAKKIQDDQNAMKSQGEVNYYAGAGLKTAALFVGMGKGQFLSKVGIAGLASTVGLYAADEAKVGDSGSTLAGHLAMGGLKGGLTKGAFQLVGNSAIESNIAKGMLMGGSARGLDLAFSPSTYTDAQGNTNLLEGAKRTVTGTFDPKAMAIDGAMFGLAGKMTESLAGTVAARPFYNTVLTSGTLGIAGGSYNELQNQLRSGNGIDAGQILYRGLLEGGVYAVAGVPGGLAADPAFRSKPLETLKSDFGTVRENLSARMDGMKQNIASLGDALTPNGLKPAYAMASEQAPGNFSMGDWRAPKPQGTFASADIPDNLFGSKLGVGAGLVGADGRPLSSSLVGPDGRPIQSTIGRAPETVDPGVDTTRVADTNEPTRRPLSNSEVGLSQLEATELLQRFTPTEAPTFQQIQQTYRYLAEHPEVDQHIAQLYVDSPNNPQMRRIIEGFYKPQDAIMNEPSLSDPRVKERYDHIIRWLEEPSPQKSAHAKMSGLLGKYIEQGFLDEFNNPRRTQDIVDIRPALEQYARLSRDLINTYIIDGALGTNYSGLVAEFGGLDRTLPLDRTTLDAQRRQSQFGSNVSNGAVQLDNEVLSTTGKPGSPEQSAALEKAAMEHGVSRETVLQQAVQVNQAVADAATNLGNGDPAVRRAAAEQLSKYLSHPTAEQWFDAWRAEAAKGAIPMGGYLSTPEMAAVPSNTMRDFLGGDWSSAYSQSQPSEIMRSKINLLNKVVQTFGGQPEVLQRVVELGKNDPMAVRQIMQNLGSKFDGQTYKSWLEQKLPTAASLDEVAGANSLQQAKLETVFKDSPEIGKLLLDKAASDPSFDLKELVFKLGKPKVGDKVRDVITERVAKDGAAADLNADSVMREVNVQMSFGRTPESAAKLIELGKADPQALDSILKEPYQMPQPDQGARGKGRDRMPPPRDPVVSRLNFAYKDILTELAPRATDIHQLTAVTDALKARNFDAAVAAAAPIEPADPKALADLHARMDAIVRKDISELPPPPPREPREGDSRGPRPPRDGQNNRGRDAQPVEHQVKAPPVQPPVDTTPVAPVDTTPVAPVDTTPVPPVDTTPVPPVDTTPVAPVDTTPVPPVDTTVVPPTDTTVLPATDPKPIDATTVQPQGIRPDAVPKLNIEPTVEKTVEPIRVEEPATEPTPRDGENLLDGRGGIVNTGADTQQWMTGADSGPSEKVLQRRAEKAARKEAQRQKRQRERGDYRGDW